MCPWKKRNVLEMIKDPMKTTGKLASMFVLLAITCIGCGGGGGSDQPDLGTVEGTVTIDEKPLSGAIVIFTPDEGRASTGLTDDDGYYELDYVHNEKGAKLGNHTITLTWPQAEDGDTPPAISIPKKYTGAQSPLKKEVKPGSNTFDFPLTSK